ncbi:MAG: prenyltransferase/squalene oxidase repeat-containing protein [Thermoguttaceae bacterium]
MTGFPKHFLVLAAALLASATALPTGAAEQWVVPTPEAQQRSVDLVRETYKEQYAAATDGARQSELAGELIKKAEETKDDPPLCFALLKEAAGLAAKAGNLWMAMKVVDDLERRFRGQGNRKAMLAERGGTRRTERAVSGALTWLANHQLADGNWSFRNYTQRCRDATCTGPGSANADAGATAMGLLPFLAAGHTHKTDGPYRGNIAAGINWLIHHQGPDGNLAKGSSPPMYSHGMATMALCEAYGLSGDKNVGTAAQGAVNFIVKAQNQQTGGWRYNPGDPGDTSVLGWQVMALKSAKMAGLSVGESAFTGAGKWLDGCMNGRNGHRYRYLPGGPTSHSMTSVGLLSRQYLGVKRDSPMMADGVKYLMNHLPDAEPPNVYYWYYASQVLHNMSGYEWDQWNRRMRKILVDSQCKESSSCANGSWDPAGDTWGKVGGRLMVTSLAALTLEVYYRYPPLYRD